MAEDDRDSLDMVAPPWWDAWQAWAYARVLPHGHPALRRFIEEKDPREWMHADDLAYEVGSEAFAAGYEALLADLLRTRGETMAQKVLRLRTELAEYAARTRQTEPRRSPVAEAPTTGVAAFSPALLEYAAGLGFDRERVRRELVEYLAWCEARGTRRRDPERAFRAWLSRTRALES